MRLEKFGKKKHFSIHILFKCKSSSFDRIIIGLSCSTYSGRSLIQIYRSISKIFSPYLLALFLFTGKFKWLLTRNPTDFLGSLLDFGDKNLLLGLTRILF